MSQPLLVVGAGGHGRVVADAARAIGLPIAGWCDDQMCGQSLLGVNVFAADAASIAAVAHELQAGVVVAFGDNAKRRRLQLELVQAGLRLISVVHPSAIVCGGVRLGAGCMVLAGAIVGVDAEIGDGAIINTAVSVDHDNQIGAFAHLSPGVHTGGEVQVGEGSHLAVGVSVRNRVSIGAWSLVGVGAAVVSDIPDFVVAYGVPARVVRTSS